MKRSNIILVVICCIVCVLLIISSFAINCRDNKKNTDIPYVLEVYRYNIELQYYAVKKELIDSLNTYISTSAHASAMNGSAFIDMSEEYNINVLFMLAQCKLESNFSTQGISIMTNSAFGVKAYDSTKNKYVDKFEHPDLSIEQYAKLLKVRYLVNGITEYDLMKKYIDAKAQRYASDPNYEAKLFRIYSELDKKYGEVYKEYLKMKTLSGK